MSTKDMIPQADLDARHTHNLEIYRQFTKNRDKKSRKYFIVVGILFAYCPKRDLLVINRCKGIKMRIKQLEEENGGDKFFIIDYLAFPVPIFGEEPKFYFPHDLLDSLKYIKRHPLSITDILDNQVTELLREDGNLLFYSFSSDGASGFVTVSDRHFFRLTMKKRYIIQSPHLAKFIPATQEEEAFSQSSKRARRSARKSRITRR